MPEDLREVARKRLDELGEEQVRSLLGHGGLPTHWTPHVHEWLKEKADENAGRK